jgi:hypothetical protein
MLRSFLLVFSLVFSKQVGRLSVGQVAAGGLEPARDAPVDHLTADPHDQATQQGLVELDLQ